ncbi:hypothetical protein PR202_ga04757 [Eleusine coracana subsp. coracana]|uniref:Uncharacterized protein n=1 Tax=Eleusine coracana subsp. coracana TaxID=191504 RepID=A0AAV5BQD9_ELECO|nr:hypothetical protein PR202_ga04757 [Eleusine coracana subsp. coracana]
MTGTMNSAVTCIVPSVVRVAVPGPSLSDDGGSSSGASTGETPRCPDLNLDLSVGLPTAAADDTPTSHSQRPVCLCYRLGLRAGEACGCQQADSSTTTSSQQGFMYFRPLEQGQYIR